MFVNCIGGVNTIPDAVRTLDDLQLWVKDGTVLRWAVVQRRYPRRVVTIFNTVERAVEGVSHGDVIVALDRPEKDTADLLDMIDAAIAAGKAITA